MTTDPVTPQESYIEAHRLERELDRHTPVVPVLEPPRNRLVLDHDEAVRLARVLAVIPGTAGLSRVITQALARDDGQEGVVLIGLPASLPF